MAAAPLIMCLNYRSPPADLLGLAVRQRDGESFQRRFSSLSLSNTDAFTGDRVSYEQLLQRVQPADVIARGDTPDQVLVLLSLDTERRNQLRLIAAPHGWPAPEPQPWDNYVAQCSDNY